MRPFDFMIAFWGKRYRDYFVDLYLPSLLAPHNFPLLRARDGHRYLIATTREDWDAIESLPIIVEMRKYITPTLIEIPDAKAEAKDGGEKFDQYLGTISRQERCFHLLLDAAYKNRSYGNLASPDMVVSDHYVSSLIRAAEQGYQLVLRPGLRQVEEDVLAELKATGVIQDGELRSLTAKPLTLSPRQVASLGARHLHPEMFAFFSDAPNQHPFPPFLIWSMGERGFILHTFFALPVLIDFTAVPEDHIACLQHRTFEEVYVKTNFTHGERVHVVEDSDELGFVSLTPRNVNWASPPSEQDGGWIHHYGVLRNLRRSAKLYGDSKVKRDLFRRPIRWHVDDIDEAWLAAERRIARFIDLSIGDFYRAKTVSVGALLRLLLLDDRTSEAPTRAWREIGRVLRVVLGVVQLIVSRLLRAARGDEEMRRWVAERFRARLGRIFRR